MMHDLSKEVNSDHEARLMADTLTTLWAGARMAWTDETLPQYGTPAWTRLNPNDPRRLASALHAAEMWRRFGNEGALVQWLADTSAAHTYATQAPARRETACKPHVLQATEGWPPIAVPGRPGVYLTAGTDDVDGMAA